MAATDLPRRAEVRAAWSPAAAIGLAAASGGAGLAGVAGILPNVFLKPLTGWIWPWLGPDRLVSFEGSLAKGLVSAGVVLPPAIAMGLVLPLVAVLIGRLGGAWAHRSRSPR